METKKSYKIAIVDDEPDICRLLKRHLEPAGHTCFIAHNGETALRIIREEGIDLLLTDVLMSGMSGLDLLNIVKCLFPDLQVLVVTGVNDYQTGKLAIELGAYGYIIKPFRQNEILINVEGALKNRFNSSTKFGQSPTSDVEASVDAERGSTFELVDEILDCIKSDVDDAEVMERFHLSVTGFHRLVDFLVADGMLEKKEVDRRASLSVGTVALDLIEPDGAPNPPGKLTVSAKEAVACIKSGMTDLELMKRFKISAKGLRSLFKKLLNSGRLTLEECYSSSACRDLVADEEIKNFHTRYLAVTTHVFDPDMPDNRCMLEGVCEDGLSVSGIKARTGDLKTLAIETRPFLAKDRIWCEAVCLGNGKNRYGKLHSNFQVTRISDEDLVSLRELFGALSLSRNFDFVAAREV